MQFELTFSNPEAGTVAHLTYHRHVCALILVSDSKYSHLLSSSPSTSTPTVVHTTPKLVQIGCTAPITPFMARTPDGAPAPRAVEGIPADADSERVLADLL